MFKPQVFISYAVPDQEQVRELAQKLSMTGFNVWVDYQELQPGERLEDSIREAINSSDYFLACFGEGGFSSMDVQIALPIASKKTSDQVFLIPVRLKEVPIPEIFQPYVVADLTLPDGLDRLMKNLAPRVPSPEPPEDLINACIKKEVVLFAGWGLWPFTGLSNWNGFISRLLDWAISNKFIEAKLIGTLQASLLRGDTNFVAESILATLGTSEEGSQRLKEFISRLYLDEMDPKPSHLNQALQKVKFCAAVSTAYDSYLENVFEISPDQILTRLNAEKGINALIERQPFLLKLYGEPRNPDSLLITSTQLRDAVKEGRGFEEFIRNLFVSRTILFIGNSLDGISGNLEALGIRNTRRKHYALVGGSTGSTWQLNSQQLESRYNIKVLPYSPGPEHTELLEFLGKLASPLETADSRSMSREKAGPIRLKKVTLENIGPFDQLTLELDPQFNILLGDNGVGKSTILRSIALAFCGKEALSYTKRLLRFGAESGKIALQATDGKEHIVELIRRLGNDPEMKITTSWALETEQWLAIGFPPLRTVGDRPLSGPGKSVGRPFTTAQDLLPLVRGGVDARTEDLKQWIINVDYQAKDKDLRSEKQLNDFFDVLEVVTDRVKFSRGVVDSKTFEISVETDDGLVPIEVVSQGTQSLLGWIGVLIQRLYDIYSKENQPLKQPALVLIDEIDAHMHPLWQQSIIGHLKELFPNIQFIATTHSPLVVSGLPMYQVLHFERIEGRVLQVKDAPADLTSGRSDQILSSELFGLNTTLDPATRNKMDRFRQLRDMKVRDKKDEKEFLELDAWIRLSMIAPQNDMVERRTQELVSLLLKQHLSDKYPELNEMMEEKTRQLIRAIQQQPTSLP